jgi:hypothetical protein
VIVLSDEFYREILAHPIPTDMEAVKVLASAPAVLDLFMWLVYRCFIAKREERIPAVWRLRINRPVGLSRIHEATPIQIDAGTMALYNSHRLAGVSRQRLRRWTLPLGGAEKSHSATNRNGQPLSRSLPCSRMSASPCRL